MRKIDEAKFNLVKTLVQQDLTNKEVARIAGIGVSTVCFIKTVDDYKGWGELRTRQAQKASRGAKRPQVLINQEKFDLVKLLLAQGLSLNRTARITQVSSTTVSRIKTCDTLDDYKKLITIYSAKAQASRKARNSRIKPRISTIQFKEMAPLQNNDDVLIQSITKLTEQVASLNNFLENKIKDENLINRLFGRK